MTDVQPSVSATLVHQFELLTQALAAGETALATSIVNEVRPVVGTAYLVSTLQQFMVHLQQAGALTPTVSDAVLDVLNPLVVAANTEKDALYVAPNLSPEVQELLLFLANDVTKETLKAGSPNWMMVPAGTYTRLLKLSKAAVDRHAS